MSETHQKERPFTTHEERINALPKSLRPQSIVEIISDVEASDSLIDVTERAYMEYFKTDFYAETNKKFKDEICLNFRLLMETLRKIKEYEHRVYKKDNERD